MKNLFKILLMVTFIVSLALGIGIQTAGAETLKVGMVYGLTGPGAQDAMNWRDVAILCKDWINEKGGVSVKGKKYQIEIIVEDGKNTLPGNVSAATKLVFQDKVKFVIGGYVPPQNDAVASVTDKNKVIYSAAKSVVVYPDKPYFFVGSNSYIAPINGLYDALKELYPNTKTVGYIVEDDPGAIAVAQLGQKTAQEKGLKVHDFHIHPWQQPEYYPEWTKIIAEKPDAVDIGLKMVATIGACIKQARELGYKGVIFTPVTTNGTVVLDVIDNKKLATDSLLITFNPYGKEAPPLVKELVQRWHKTHKEKLWDNCTESWDNLWTLVQAIEKAQSLDTTEVAKAWASMQSIKSCRGEGKMGGLKAFGINHMVFTPCGLTRLKDGELDFIKWYIPWMP